MRLIDADELKTILSEEITRRFVRWDKTITVAEWETFTRDAIDNAPTVEERPQGEWIKNGGDYQCNQCFEWCISNEEHLPIRSNFCPNCGASMKKGGAE